MDIPDDRVYPRKAADLQKVTAVLEASPGYLAPCMKMLQSQLTGHDRLVLSASPVELAEKLARSNMSIRSKSGRCHTKFCNSAVLFRRRSSKSPVWNVSRSPFQLMLKKPKSSKPPTNRTAATHRLSAPPRPAVATPRPIWRLRSRPPHAARPGTERSDGERRVSTYYLRAIPTQEQTDEIARLVRKLCRNHPRPQPQPRIPQRLERPAMTPLTGLVLLRLKRAISPRLLNSLALMTLDAFPDGPWTNGARYNLARC